jgi:glutathione synthase/RimK-type ligase-like ATP-grasp enzyme
MPVIDDPVSMIRCTNKVYLDELMAANGIPVPAHGDADRAGGFPARR